MEDHIHTSGSFGLRGKEEGRALLLERRTRRVGGRGGKQRTLVHHVVVTVPRKIFRRRQRKGVERDVLEAVVKQRIPSDFIRRAQRIHRLHNGTRLDTFRWIVRLHDDVETITCRHRAIGAVSICINETQRQSPNRMTEKCAI